MQTPAAIKWLTTLAVLLAAGSALVGIEWPLPKFAAGKIKEVLAKKEITVQFARATFDLGGHIRLLDVRGRYQGLLEVEARQMLLGVFNPEGVEITLDEGVLHTEFLLLPIPERIEIAGCVQLKKEGLYVRSVRVKALPVIAQVQGLWAYPKPKANTLGDTAVVEKMAKRWQAVGGLLRLSSGWMVEVNSMEEGIHVRAWGESFVSNHVTVEGPKVSFGYPQQTLAASAERVSGPWGRVSSPSVVYHKADNDFWLASLGTIELPKITFRGAVATGRLPIERISYTQEASGLAARVFLDEGSARAFNVKQNPFTADYTARAKSDVLGAFGLKLSTEELGYGEGHLWSEGLDFRVATGKGLFYQYPYTHLTAKGSVNKNAVALEQWNLASDDGVARGSLDFNFESHRARYKIIAEAAPYNLPWFGAWWAKGFEPFVGLKAAVALVFENRLQDAPVVAGVVGANGFKYKRLGVDAAAGTIVSRDRNTYGRFWMTTGTESGQGAISWTPDVELNFAGKVTPANMAKAYLPETPVVLENLQFSELPDVTAHEKGGRWEVSVATPKPVAFQTFNFDYLSAKVRGDTISTVVDPLMFGFAKGAGRAQATLGLDGKGSGSFTLTGANLGEWSMMGQLGQRFKGSFLGFSTLNLSGAQGDFVFTPDRVEVPRLDMVGDEHAVAAIGSINTKENTMDFKVRLKTLGGQRAALGILAPLVQPFTSVVEARVTGPVAKPNWSFGLTAPSLFVH